MIKEFKIVVSPEQAADNEALKKIISESNSSNENEITALKIIKRSVDARSRSIKVNLTIQAYINEPLPEKTSYAVSYPDVSKKKSVIIIGAGPAGLFAALRLIELGIKPIIIERGKDVRERRKDLAAINRDQVVNSDSNYCFGEGGAGTYSDGKLYTRSTKRGEVQKILETFVGHGASEDILIEAHPHIGTNKLPQIIVNIRENILTAGGEIHFNTRLQDFIITDNKIKGVVCMDVINSASLEILADAVILATGHSARDIFELLHSKNILIEAKSFAMGVRIEHPQDVIDSIQYHCSVKEVADRRKYLPAASYSLVHQVEGRGVYSFCMCPGGIIAPCATNAGEVVTNGWSPSKRNNPFANSGMVVSIDLSDLKKYEKHGPLAGMYYQKELEQAACIAGGSKQVAPAQRMMDFVNNKLSPDLPPVSYRPGINSVQLQELLPKAIAKRLQEGLKEFGKNKKGYLTNEAVLVAVESRTSSPVRIPRDKDTLQHPQIKGLFPCGEGAGYAGGIISAAIDGQRVAEMSIQLV